MYPGVRWVYWETGGGDIGRQKWGYWHGVGRVLGGIGRHWSINTSAWTSRSTSSKHGWGNTTQAKSPYLRPPSLPFPICPEPPFSSSLKTSIISICFSFTFLVPHLPFFSLIYSNFLQFYLLFFWTLLLVIFVILLTFVILSSPSFLFSSPYPILLHMSRTNNSPLPHLNSMYRWRRISAQVIQECDTCSRCKRSCASNNVLQPLLSSSFETRLSASSFKAALLDRLSTGFSAINFKVYSTKCLSLVT